MVRNEQKRGFKDLLAWQRADELASLVYRASKDIQPADRWLRDQILRCAVSVPANIAEGHGRGSKAELLRFIDIARGSLSELEYVLHFLHTEELLTPEKLLALDAKRIEAGKVIYGLWRSLKAMAPTAWDHSGNQLREERAIYSVSEV